MEELFMEKDDPFLENLLKEFFNDRVIICNDTIDTSCFENVSLKILKFNKEDKLLPVKSRKPIWLFLQSPGGAVVSGFNLIDVIESSSTPVYTVCFANCSSMAFHIFISGNKRYAFKNSVLLNHDGDTTISNSTSKARDTMQFFNTLEDRIKNHVLSHTKMTPEFYDSIYNKEYYMYANDKGKELGCVDYIIGEDVALNDILS